MAFAPPSNPRWLLPPSFLRGSWEAARQLRGGERGAGSGEAAAEAPGAGSALRVRGCQRAREPDVGGVGLGCLGEDGAVSEPLAAGGHQSIRGWGRGRGRKTGALGGAGAASAKHQQCQQRRRRRRRPRRRQWQRGTKRVRRAGAPGRKGEL